MMKDYYFILGLPQAADKYKIKQAYRKKAKTHHPDKCDTRENRRKFMDIKEAYDILSDDAKRAKYDQALNKKQSPQPRSPRFTSPPRSRPGKTAGAPIQDTNEVGSGRSRRHVHDLRLEFILTPEESANGGGLPLTVPICRPCSFCLHKGVAVRLICPVCGGEGIIRTEKTVVVNIPPHIKNGATLRQLAHDDGHTLTYLHATVLIDPGR